MKTPKRIIFFLTIPLFFLSCASLGSGFYEKTGLTVTDQINKGMHESLTEESLYPFVFETEILASESQVKMLWEGLTGAGYTLDSPVITMNRPATSEDSSLFSDSWEIGAFFGNYIQKDDRILLIEGSHTSFYLLMRKMEKRQYKLLGWKEAQK